MPCCAHFTLADSACPTITTTLMSKPRKIRPPVPIVNKYPGFLERTSYRIYNSIFNSLYPVSPVVFGVTTAAFAAYFSRNRRIPNLISKLGLKRGEYVRIALASLFSSYIPVFICRLILKQFYFKYKGFLSENPKKPSLLTKIWAIIGAALNVVAKPRLLSCDNLLPSPAVPTLEQTIKSYLQSLEPLHTKEEMEEAKLLAKEFLNGEGRKLQRYARFYSLFVENYVTNFWEKFAYLYTRDCLLINSSVAHGDLFESIPATQAVMAATTVYVEALTSLAIDRQTLVPPGKGLLCSRHYDRMFCVTRVPGEEIDHWDNYGISRHVAVIFNGGIYKVSFVHDDGRLYTVKELTDVFNELLARKGTKVEGPEGMIPALTHDKRTAWANNRKRFFLDIANNKEILKVIESSATMLILDDDENCGYNWHTSEGASHFMSSMITGNGVNRWVDKSMNYVVTKSGTCGGNGEHSVADGSELDHIMEIFQIFNTQILKYPSLEEQHQRAKELNVEKVTKGGVKLAERLQIEMQPGMADEITRCYDSYASERDDLDLVTFILNDWGKGRIKKCGVSPDAFVQMAIQLTQFKDQGRFVHTYEAASARFYRNSRTETLRSVTAESCAFVNAMLDPRITIEDRVSHLNKAAELHTSHSKDCMVNKGVDRHLFVLFVLSKAQGVSSPFLDRYVQQEWPLSTSNLPNMTNSMKEDEVPGKSWIGGCFAAVAKTGYGVCYRFAGDHSICIHVTSYHSAENTSSSRFMQRLTESFREMADLFD